MDAWRIPSGYPTRMARTSNYESSGQLVDKAERSLDTPERILAAAQVDALRAVVDQLAHLTAQAERIAVALERLEPVVEIPKALADGAETVRMQIRAAAGI